MKIGLFGGSFDPAHAGHIHVIETAMARLDLDRIWVMVSPQNPLKPRQRPQAERAATLAALGLPPRVTIEPVEGDLGTVFTCDTVRALRARRPRDHFVFIMGADNFAQLPLWKDWTAIAESLPICVVARPGERAIRVRLGRAARRYAGARISESQAHTLALRKAPAWTFISAPLNAMSSTRLRNQARESGVDRMMIKETA